MEIGSSLLSKVKSGQVGRALKVYGSWESLRFRFAHSFEICDLMRPAGAAVEIRNVAPMAGRLSCR